MRVTFLGATHEVTGSCTLLEACGHNILIDCGMEQGADTFVNRDIPVNPAAIDCVLLTHAHIDHSGKIPLLFKNGFRGNVYATSATSELCGIMLRDSAHIQMADAEWKTRKAKRAGGEEVLPVYDMNDAEGVLKKFVPCAYGSPVCVSEGVTVSFTDIGHLLGSSSVQIEITENGKTEKIVFSGDIGNINQPILNDPKAVTDADYVVIESTYGDRLHPARPDYVGNLTAIIQRTLDRGGNVIIPSFAVGRTQELLYFIRQIKTEGRIHGHDGFRVYVDSPLAVEATGIFMQCDTSNFDSDTLELIGKGIDPLYFDGLKTVVTSEESKLINADPEPKIIISASGMCEAGRIRHHLKHNLWRKESLVLFVGYQSAGTLGRLLCDGAKEVKLFGETISVECEISTLAGISGHADRDGLLRWLDGFEKKPRKIFVNHGEDTVCDGFARLISQEKGIPACAPFSGTSFDLISGELTESEGIPVPPKSQAGGGSPVDIRRRNTLRRLIAAAERLVTVARKLDGRPNKELASYASQIDSLADKMLK